MLAAGTPPLRADEVACKPSGHHPSTTGVVLLHGALDPSNLIMPLRNKMAAAGFRVAMPEMPWSETREYNRTYQQAMDEITAAAAPLRQKGAARIVVGGFSYGSNAAVGYAALRGGVAGVMVISPGLLPDDPGFFKIIEPGVAKARQMVEAGLGDKFDIFKDVAQWHGSTAGAYTTAKNYLSYFDPMGDAVIPKNIMRVGPGIPLLWIIGKDDPESMALGRAYAFDKAKPNPLSRYLVVPGGHINTPATGANAVVAWLKCL